MARVRAAASSAQMQSKPARDNPTRGTRAALKEKTNTTTALAHTDDGNGKKGSEDVGLLRGRAAKRAKEKGELVVADARGKRSQEGARSGDALSKTRDMVASNTVGTKNGTVNGDRRARGTALQRDAATEVMASTTSSSRTATKRRRAPEVSHTEEPVQRSEFSISPSPPASNRKSPERKGAPRPSVAPPGSALKFQSTPAAAESSVMALKNFKRRPRQPSMLAMVQQYHQSQRARESAAGTTAIGADTEIEDPSVHDVDAALELDGEEEDFAPEAEGTPAHLKKRPASSAAFQAAGGSHKTARVPSASKSSQKRKSTAMEDSQIRENSTRAKRQLTENTGTRPDNATRSRSDSLARLQDTSEVQVINSSPEQYSTESVLTRLDGELNLAGIEQDLEAESLVPCTGPNGADKQTSFGLTRFLEEGDGDAINSTMADPVSSSPVALQVPEDAIMAYPATQMTQQPPSPDRRGKANTKKAKALDTAALQNLLPKKRQRLEPRRRKSEYDFIEVSDEEVSDHNNQPGDEDEDELNAPTRRRTTKAVLSTKQSSMATKGRQSKASTQARNMKVVASRNSAAKRTSRVYGKAGAPDNQEGHDDSWEAAAEEDAEESILPDISISSIEAMKSRELQEAARKFAEIDNWEGMEFESDNEHRSSSQGWR